jgi:hypothetical protein
MVHGWSPLCAIKRVYVLWSGNATTVRRSAASSYLRDAGRTRRHITEAQPRTDGNGADGTRSQVTGDS